MSVDPGRLSVTRIIVHDMPTRRKGQPSQFTPTQAESSLNQDLVNFFNKKIRENLGKGLDIVRDAETSSPVPDLIRRAIQVGGEDFVAISREIAQQLDSVQDGSNTDGILAVMLATHAKNAAMALMKLQRQNGVRLLPSMTEDNQTTFELATITDLMMSDEIKVFKAAAIILESDPNGGDEFLLVGKACDPQRGAMKSKGVARFFLSDFLGFQLASEPRVATRSFFDAFDMFINQEIADPQIRAQYLLAGMAELASNREQVDVRGFIDENIHDRDRATLEHFLQDSQVPMQFEKDAEFIEGRLAQFQIRLASGITVIGGRDAMSEKVKISESSIGTSIIEIVDDVKAVTTKR